MITGSMYLIDLTLGLLNTLKISNKKEVMYYP